MIADTVQVIDKAIDKANDDGAVEYSHESAILSHQERHCYIVPSHRLSHKGMEDVIISLKASTMYQSVINETVSRSHLTNTSLSLHRPH